MEEFMDWLEETKPGYSVGGPLYDVAFEAFKAGYQVGLSTENSRPPNTQMHVDTKPCDYCEANKEYLDGFSFCPECGRALSQ